MKLTALIEREGDGYVSLCPELDVASQGKTIEEARDNLREALELFFESASATDWQAIIPHGRHRLRLLSCGANTFKYDLGSEDREGNQECDHFRSNSRC